jgi:hypothetical protein
MRPILRLLGLALVAVAFVLAIIDGTASLANSELRLTPLGKTAFELFPTSFPVLQPAVERHIHPLLWDPVILNLLLLPTAAVAFGLGLLLFWLGRPRPPLIGYSSRDAT